MHRILCSITFLLQLGAFSSAIAQEDAGYQLEVSYSYGTNQLFPSLIANSNLAFDRANQFSDIWVKGGFKISEQLSYQVALEVTDQPHELILTKYSRPDYPLTTGRIQRSVVKYESSNLTVRVGRDDMLSNKLRPSIFYLPAGGDGFVWYYQLNDWGFKHVFQVLPAETFGNQVFRRSVSYHHLTKNINNHTFGAGEYFILSGNQISFDLKRLNPFLPYIVNSHDSEADNFSGFYGDTDNSLVKLFWERRGESSTVGLNLYIDEFQIDAVDREVYSDAILLSFYGATEVTVFNQQSSINYGLSWSNPNFGQHPGPFTTTSIGIFPLFEYTPGMQSLYFLEANFFTDRRYQFSLSGFTEKWLNIAQLSPQQMNLRDELDELDVHTDSRVSIRAQYRFKDMPVKLGGTGWFGTDGENNSGAEISLQLNWGNSPKL
jgi:hypothetical protein